MSETTPFVFISYARKDGREYAKRLYGDLTARGYGAWWDERSLDYEQDFTADIEKALEKATHVAVCITPASKKSDHPNEGYVRRELLYALMLKKPIIPLRFADIPPHIQIINLIWIDFWNGAWETSFDAFDSRLKVPLNEWKDRFGEAEPFTDPFAEYLQSLYQSIVSYISQTVFSEITLRSTATPDAVNAPAKAAPPIKTRVMGTALINNPAPISAPQPEQIEFENFAGAFEHYKGRVLLLGEPGAGKSTTLMAFARDRVSKRLSDQSAPLPVFGRIATWDALEALSLRHWLTEEEEEETAERIKAEIEAGQALLLLDGLDELGSVREVEVEDPKTGEKKSEQFDPRLKFIQAVPIANQVLMTCRVTDYEQIGNKVTLNGAVTLSPLSDKQIEGYLSEYPHLWEALQTDEALKDIARTPLLLSIFTYAFKEMDEKAAELSDLAKSPGDLRDAIFRMYVERRWAHEARRSSEPLPYDVEGLHRELGKIAAKNVRFSDANENLFKSYEFPAPLLEFGLRLNLLTVVYDTSVRFAHLLLCDYLAFKWAMGSLADGHPQMRSDAARALGNLGDMRAVESLIRAMADVHVWVRSEAAEALGKLGDARAGGPLIRALADENSAVRSNAARALGNLGDMRAVDLLIRALRDTTAPVRLNAAEALGRIGDVRAIEPLIIALADPVDTYVQGSAAKALARFGAPAIDPLINTLANATAVEGDTAAWALTQIGESAVDPLIRALTTRNAYVRSNAAWALGELGDARAFKPLIRGLTDYYYYVRSSAAEALGKLKAERAVGPLIKRLGDKSDRVRSSAAVALGELKAERAVGPLIKRLGDKSDRVRFHAEDALIKIGTPEALAAVEEWRKGQG